MACCAYKTGSKYGSQSFGKGGTQLLHGGYLDGRISFIILLTLNAVSYNMIILMNFTSKKKKGVYAVKRKKIQVEARKVGEVGHSRS
jgi:hypothetical protein